MSIIENHTGEFAALLTAVFWTVTALSFESAGHRIGSVALNILRLVIGLVFLGVYTFISRGLVFPSDASYENWIWLSLSGLVGFVFGDLFLFQVIYNYRFKVFDANNDTGPSYYGTVQFFYTWRTSFPVQLPWHDADLLRNRHGYTEP